MVKWLHANHPKSVSIVGHSLGAALAQLAAFDLCKDWAVARVVVFASPMIGDGRFNKEYARKPVYGGQALLGERTIRYLLLTDRIFNPIIPKFSKYEAFPVVSIDEYGRKAQYLPNFFLRLGGALLPDEQPVGPPSLYRRTPEEAEILPREQKAEPMIAAILPHPIIWATLPGLGGWGFAAKVLLAGIIVRHRDWGFHDMKRYERALQWKARA